MRDPRGQLEIDDARVLRRLFAPLRTDDFLNTSTARALVESGDLVDFSLEDAGKVSSPRVPFVSFPYEWTNAQLADAAALTLEISDRILADGFELKDASAWNVLFKGTKPQFCDHLSFARVDDLRWWAFAQYVRHFVLPLCLSRFRGLDARDVFRIHRDGLSPESARSLMGIRRFATRYWPLMTKPSGKRPSASRARAGKTYHRNLYALCRWYMNGVSPSHEVRSHWSAYVEERDQYSDRAVADKRKLVARWLGEIRPTWVIDLGCNTGEFSRLAKNLGAQVVAIDLDHSSVQSFYLSCPNDVSIYPLVANFEDVTAGRGWRGREFPGLVSRLSALGDVTMMLALIHHLSISHGVPYKEIAALAHAVTKRMLIVELVEHDDPHVDRLCAQRRRNPSEFTLAAQHSAFEKFFVPVAEARIGATKRHLVLMERR